MGSPRPGIFRSAVGRLRLPRRVLTWTPLAPPGMTAIDGRPEMVVPPYPGPVSASAYSFDIRCKMQRVKIQAMYPFLNLRIAIPPPAALGRSSMFAEANLAHHFLGAHTRILSQEGMHSSVVKARGKAWSAKE